MKSGKVNLGVDRAMTNDTSLHKSRTGRRALLGFELPEGLLGPDNLFCNAAMCRTPI
jgi:hypothetical protein